MDAKQRRKSLRVVALLSMGTGLLTGCGVVQSTVSGLTDASPPPAPNVDASGEIVIEVRFDSDETQAESASVEVRSPNSGQSLQEETIELPFSREFTIALDTFLPFRGVTASAEAAAGATFISCEIIIDGESVSSHRSEGDNARAECERSLRLGPS